MVKQNPTEAAAAHAARQRARRASRSAEDVARDRVKDALRKREAKKAETPEQAACRRKRDADNASTRRYARQAIPDSWRFRDQQPHPPHPSDSTDTYELKVIPNKIDTFVHACPADNYTCLAPFSQSEARTCQAGHPNGYGLDSIPVTLTTDQHTFTATIVNPAVAALLYPGPNANPLDDNITRSQRRTQQRTRRLKLTQPVPVKATTRHINHTTFITNLEVLNTTMQQHTAPQQDGGV